MSEFDLEGAIAQWRERLSWREAFTEADLDEMEGHLWEEVDALISSRQTEKEAFFQAVHQFGEDYKLSWRFNQANWEQVMVKRTLYAPTLVGNYFKVAVRNLLKHKLYSFINISGLALGMACCILILLFVQYEMTYDQFYSNSDRIYRLIREDVDSEGSVFSRGVSGGLAPLLNSEFPEIKHAIRITDPGDLSEFWDDYWQGWVRHKDQMLPVHGCQTDPDFFKVFQLPFLSGDSNTALVEPYSVVITKKMAQKLFKEENPMGKVVTFAKAGDFKVTGVIADIPENSTINFDFLTSTHESFMPWDMRNLSYGWRPLQIFVLLKKGSDPEQLTQKFPDFIARHFGQETHIRYHLQPLGRVHLYSNQDYGLQGYGEISYVYLFALVAFFILLLACLNYVNLSTARSIHRAREVGMRKVVGAFRKKLVGQFLGESVFLALLALPVTLLLIELALPVFNRFMGNRLEFINNDRSFLFVLYLAFFVSGVGILSGIYPAFFLSRFKPVEVLKGTLAGTKSVWLRKSLVVFQFAVSILLVTTTGVVYQQLDFMQHRQWGYNKDEVVILPIFQADPSEMWSEEWLGSKWWRTRNQVVRHPAVLNATVSHVTPPYGISTKVKVAGTNTPWNIQYITAHDQHFLDTYGIKLLVGRNFRGEGNQEDARHALMLNETAVKYLGLDDPIGKQIEWIDVGRKMTVIGVMKDFQNQQANQKVTPMFLSIVHGQPPQQLSLRVDMARLPEVMAFLKETWARLMPARPFHYAFANAHLENSYRWYTRLGQICGVFAILALFVACLGLFGMASFTAEQRTKEIGIRKILGASSKNIVVLISKEFTWLVIAANAVIWPVAYYVLDKWLMDFAYRIDLSLWTFAVTGLLTLVIALLTVILQTWKAARSNPVDALRYE